MGNSAMSCANLESARRQPNCPTGVTERTSMRILLISDIHFESPKCNDRHSDPDWYYRNALVNELDGKRPNSALRRNLDRRRYRV